MLALLLAALAIAPAAQPVADAGPPGFAAADRSSAAVSGRARPLIIEGTGAPSLLRVNVRGRFLVLRSPNGIDRLGERCTAVSPNIQRCRKGAISALVIKGFGGKDRFKATGRVRTRIAMLGGAGNDIIVGGSGDDRLDGGKGLDRLFGRGGGDLLRGGAAGDVLGGGPGDDTVNGGPGRDQCSGGPGADLIVFCP
jgi:hypothetical protein